MWGSFQDVDKNIIEQIKNKIGSDETTKITPMETNIQTILNAVRIKLKKHGHYDTKTKELKNRPKKLTRDWVGLSQDDIWNTIRRETVGESFEILDQLLQGGIQSKNLYMTTNSTFLKNSEFVTGAKDLRQIETLPAWWLVLEYFIMLGIKNDLTTVLSNRIVTVREDSNPNFMKMRASLNKNIYRAIIDVSEAYPSINLEVLEKTGADEFGEGLVGRIVDVFRNMKINIGGIEFSRVKGITQGSRLGPALFALVINDIAKKVDKSWWYINDIYMEADTKEELETNLTNLLAELNKKGFEVKNEKVQLVNPDKNNGIEKTGDITYKKNFKYL